MSRITSKFVVYPSDSDYYKLRHLKKFRKVTLSGSPKSQSFKKSITSLRTSKSLQTVKFQSVECISARTFSLLVRLFYKSFKAVKKLVFESDSHDFPLQRKIFALKKIFKNISQLQTLAVVSVDTNNIKYCRSLQNIKLSLPETTHSTSIVSQIRHLRNLQRAEVCISNEDQALTMIKEVQQRIKSKHCLLDITLMKAFWPCMDNIESFSQQTFKKVASVELNLASLPSTPPSIDNDTLEAHSKFLKFLYEPVTSSQRRRRRKLVECIKFPGMKLQIDSKEYDSPPKIYSLLESFLSVYDSSVLHVKEYSPENNLAKLYFELTSWASSWEIYELLKDIIEFKDIKFLHLELDVQGMTELEFRNIIEKICKIEKLQFLSVASGKFSIEVKQPSEVSLNGGISSEIRHMVETRS